MAILEVKNIKKGFGSTDVLKGVSFSLEKGQVLAIIGSSGSGKTTLFRCLNFLETPDAGEIFVDGQLLNGGQLTDEQIRAAVTELEPRNEIGRCLFTKQPEPLKRDRGYRYQHDVIDLLRALDMIAERNARQLPPPTTNFTGIVGKEPYPIGRKTGEVLRQLVLRGVERLKNLFRGNKSRSEIVATFLAVLDLCKTNSVTLEDDINGDNPNVRLLDEEEKKELIAHGI